jgi:hypothetical protein
MNITINGIPTIFTPFYASTLPEVSNPNGRIFQFVGRSADNKDGLGITIQVPGNFTVGTYHLNNTGYTLIVDYYKDWGQANEKIYGTDPAPGQPQLLFLSI